MNPDLKTGKSYYDSNSQVGDPRDFGAIYDGITDCAEAINKCIQTHDHIILRGSNTALITTPIILRAGTWLDLDPCFTVKLADRANCVMLKNKWAESAYFSEKNGHPDFMSELYPDFDPNKWVLGAPEKNMRITGGVFDGNGANQERQDWRYGAMGYYGTALIFVNIENFELANVNIKNPLTYNAEFHIMKNFRMSNINLDYDAPRPNIDGIHLGGDCYDGVIDGVTGKTFDDMIALNGGDCWHPKPSKDGVKLDQADKLWYPFAQGKIANIEIRSIMAENSFRAVRFLSNVKVPESPENETEGMDNILIDGVYGSYTVNAISISSHIGGIKPYGNITLRNIKNTLTPESRMPNILAEEKTTVNNLIIDDYYHKTEFSQDPLALIGNANNVTLRDIFIDASDNVDLTNRKAIEIGGKDKTIKRLTLDNVFVNDENMQQYSMPLHLSNVKKINVSNSNVGNE